MGEYRYAVVELPPSPYAHDLQEVLAFVFDIGVNLAGCTGEPSPRQHRSGMRSA